MNEISASDVSAPKWGLRLFGHFELSRLESGERMTLSGRRERVLLAYLALRSGGRTSRRKLATLLWGEASDETSLDKLRVCVWSLRKVLGDSGRRLIASEGDDIVLDLESVEPDILKFR